MILLLLVHAGLAAAPAFAQYPGNAPMGPAPSESDVLEVEDIADEEYSLPDDELLKDDDEDVSETIEEIDRQRRRELALSANEKRARFQYVGGLMLGIGRPWMIYSLDVGYLRTPRQAFGMYAGGGGITSSGITDEKAYDMTVRSRGSGFFFRHWFEKVDLVSLDFSLGYAAWEGKVTPHGSDPEDTSEDILTSSFRGSGISAGIGANLTWIWNTGFHLEWIPILIHYSKFLQKDVARDSDVVRETIRRNMETPLLNGLTSLRLGYYF